MDGFENIMNYLIIMIQCYLDYNKYEPIINAIDDVIEIDQCRTEWQNYLIVTNDVITEIEHKTTITTSSDTTTLTTNDIIVVILIESERVVKRIPSETQKTIRRKVEVGQR